MQLNYTSFLNIIKHYLTKNIGFQILRGDRAYFTYGNFTT